MLAAEALIVFLAAVFIPRGAMMPRVIKAVVLDIGSVLEVIDDALFPAALRPYVDQGSPAIEAALEAMDAETKARVLEEYWRWYVGTLDQELFDWFAGLRPARLTGILSNSAPGAREAERCWGFEAITDDIVYSHEVGLRKPDPAIYALATQRLGVRPEEIVFVDDVETNVVAAREAGWFAIRHGSPAETPATIRAVERIVEEQSVRP